MPIEPLAPSDAKQLILSIIKKGTVTYAQPHALERMVERQISMPDCVNVLRGGIPQPGEYITGSWRYQVCTPKICIVVRFESKSELEVVTAWRRQ